MESVGAALAAMLVAAPLIATEAERRPVAPTDDPGKNGQGQVPTCQVAPPSLLCRVVLPQVEPAMGWSLPWAK